MRRRPEKITRRASDTRSSNCELNGASAVTAQTYILPTESRVVTSPKKVCPLILIECVSFEMGTDGAPLFR